MTNKGILVKNLSTGGNHASRQITERKMKHYALIEYNSRYVWWIGPAKSAVEACRKADQETGGEYDNEYEGGCHSSQLIIHGGYLVYEVPEGFDAVAGQEDLVEAFALVDCVRVYKPEEE